MSHKRLMEFAPTGDAMRRRVLLNATNLHIGGGVQVAASVLSEIEGLEEWHQNVDLAVSSEVERAYGRPDLLKHLFDRVFRLDVFGLGSGGRGARRILNRYERVLTLFGPLYRWSTPFSSVVGFAQAWIIYPRNEVYRRLRWNVRIGMRIKFWVQAQFFKRADIIVVELEHVKQGLTRELGIPPERIIVVRNCVASLYFNPSRWDALLMPDVRGKIRLGFLGRNYVHKNTLIFPKIAAALRSRHGLDSSFFVTFTEAEWHSCTDEFRAACINVGPLSPAQCPLFYLGLDGVIFPSLLECFSATPLEAMVMGKPLFASDRPFNRDICSSHARYFDPLDPIAAADEIARLFKSGGPTATEIAEARHHAISFSSPRQRAKSYLSLLSATNNHQAQTE